MELADGSSVLLVAPFKHGADSLASPFEGAVVRLSGSLIERGRLRMVEIQPGSMERVDAAADHSDAAHLPAPEDERPPVSVRGEIVDGKCWLGVMKPGRGTVHRACARLCVRGGIPPLIVFRDGEGVLRTALVTTTDGDRVGVDILRYVARPVEVTGIWAPDAAGGTGTFALDSAGIRIL
jgi:hypothetical protein